MSDDAELRDLLSRILGDDGPDLDAYIDGHAEPPSVPVLHARIAALEAELKATEAAFDQSQRELGDALERSDMNSNFRHEIADLLEAHVFPLDAEKWRAALATFRK